MKGKRNDKSFQLFLNLGKFKNKRGELLVNETLKIILSVIAISVLIFFLVSLYYSRVYDAKFVDAQNTIARISNVVNDGGGEVNGLTPRSWSVFAFVTAEKPNSCAGQSCLCICDPISKFNFWKSQLKECSEKGVCTIVPGLTDFEEIKIEKDLTNINIQNSGGLFIVSKK